MREAANGTVIELGGCVTVLENGRANRQSLNSHVIHA